MLPNLNLEVANMTTKTQKQDQDDLAACFLRVERAGGTLEGIANGMFAPLKAKKIKTLEQFNAEVMAAYEKNAWSRKAGRPAVGAKEKPAPDAVQVYVSRFRAAYRLKLNVISFTTIGEMREAISKRKQAAHHAADRPPELKGIHLSSENSLIEGALFHNVPTLWQLLPDDKKEMFYRQVEKVYNQYVKSAPPDLVKAA